MQTTNSFDLNQAIQQWRESLSQSPAFGGENLDELESHLRDSMAKLETDGLSPQEAFYVGVSRIGGMRELSHEFGKVNGDVVWRQRALWMLAGMLFLIIGREFSRCAAAAATCFASLTQMSGILLGWISICTQMLALGLIAALFWRLATGRLSRWSPNWIGSRRYSVGYAMILLGGIMLLELTAIVFEMFWIRNLSPQMQGQTFAVTTWFNVTSPVFIIVIVVMLIRLVSVRVPGERGAEG